MGKIKRGNYQFLTWIGNHDYYVHIYKNDVQVLKWDLQRNRVIQGRLTKKLKMIKLLWALDTPVDIVIKKAA